jgi:hypothetical protein
MEGRLDFVIGRFPFYFSGKKKNKEAVNLIFFIEWFGTSVE